MAFSSTSEPTWPADDVLVVGAGPAGLLVAGILARAGVAVVVLEAQQWASQQSRASTLHARAMEILDHHQVPGLAFVPRLSTGHYAGISIDLMSVKSSWRGQWKLTQPELVSLLTSWAQASGARIMNAAPVVRVEQSNNQVRLRTADGSVFHGRFVVGADGHDSLVRREAGIAVTAYPAPRRLVRADVAVQELQARRFERVGELTLTAAPLGGNVTRVVVHDPAWSVDHVCSTSALRELWMSATAETITGDITWIDHFCDSTAVAEDFVHGRIILCGDAAHQFVPVGGESLNSAIFDAHNLAWKLALTVRTPNNSSRLLDSYATERHAAAHNSGARIRHQIRLLFSTDPAATRDKVQIEQRLRDDKDFHQRIATAVAGVDVGYPGEPQPVNPRLSAAKLAGLDLPRRRVRPVEIRLPTDVCSETLLGMQRSAHHQLQPQTALVRPDDHWITMPSEPYARASLLQTWASACTPRAVAHG